MEGFKCLSQKYFQEKHKKLCRAQEKDRKTYYRENNKEKEK